MIVQTSSSRAVVVASDGQVVTIEEGCDWRQIVVRWDNGQNLIVILPADAIEFVVEHEVN